MFDKEYTEKEIAKGKENLLAGATAFVLVGLGSALQTLESCSTNAAPEGLVPAGIQAAGIQAACIIKQNPLMMLGMAGVSTALFLNTREGRAAAYNMLPGFLKAKQDVITEQEEPVLRRSARLKNKSI